MGHESVGRGAVPVILSWFEEDAIAGPDDLDWAAALAATDSLQDVDRLAVGVRVPGRSGAGGRSGRLRLAVGRVLSLQ
jgi:hypothetical protein